MKLKWWLLRWAFRLGFLHVEERQTFDEGWWVWNPVGEYRRRLHIAQAQRNWAQAEVERLKARLLERW